jgi:hypothetical protein
MMFKQTAVERKVLGLTKLSYWWDDVIRKSLSREDSVSEQELCRVREVRTVEIRKNRGETGLYRLQTKMNRVSCM